MRPSNDVCILLQSRVHSIARRGMSFFADPKRTTLAASRASLQILCMSLELQARELEPWANDVRRRPGVAPDAEG